MSKQPLFDQLDQFITEMLTNPDVMVRSADVDDALLEELLGIARDLPDLPAPGFKVSLKASLQAEFRLLAVDPDPGTAKDFLKAVAVSHPGCGEELSKGEAGREVEVVRPQARSFSRRREQFQSDQ